MVKSSAVTVTATTHTIYPTKVFCSTRHSQNKNPIVDTLWHCEDYNKVSQECYCVTRSVEEEKRRRIKRKVKVNNWNDVLFETCSPVV